MKILVFDTETNGLPKSRNESIFNTTEFPYILQLSYILYDSECNKIIKYKDLYVKDVEIKEESFKINNISKDILDKKGENIKNVLNDFIDTIKLCDILVAHNYSFDKKIIMAECVRNQLFYKLNYVIKQKNNYCTMINSKNICKIININYLNNTKYPNNYKYPKLIELHKKLFNIEINSSNLHNSLIDCIYTLKCYYKMIYDVNLFEINEELINLQNI